MTVKELKSILNKCPNENADIFFTIGEPLENDSWLEIELDNVSIEPDFMWLSFYTSREDKERATIVISEILKYLYAGKRKPEETKVTIDYNL